MKKIFLPIILFCLLSIIFIPILAKAADCPVSGDPGATGLVSCGVTCNCTISNVFLTLLRIYNFIVIDIAGFLAVVALTVGGIMILVSAGNPNTAGTGKKILYAAIIGLALVFCSWIIIDFVFRAVGGTGNWSTLPT